MVTMRALFDQSSFCGGQKYAFGRAERMSKTGLTISYESQSFCLAVDEGRRSAVALLKTANAAVLYRPGDTVVPSDMTGTTATDHAPLYGCQYI